MAEKAEISKKDAEAALKAFTEVVTDELKAGGKVALVGFGTFEAAEVAERKGIVQMGPNKGSEYITPAHRAPKFKAGKALKSEINA
jgi:DNA-binding protein HU-beta